MKNEFYNLNDYCTFGHNYGIMKQNTSYSSNEENSQNFITENTQRQIKKTLNNFNKVVCKIPKKLIEFENESKENDEFDNNYSKSLERYKKMKKSKAHFIEYEDKVEFMRNNYDNNENDISLNKMNNSLLIIYKNKMNFF